jgi:hypothetical protein
MLVGRQAPVFRKNLLPLPSGKTLKVEVVEIPPKCDTYYDTQTLFLSTSNSQTIQHSLWHICMYVCVCVSVCLSEKWLGVVTGRAYTVASLCEILWSVEYWYLSAKLHGILSWNIIIVIMLLCHCNFYVCTHHYHCESIISSGMYMLLVTDC